MASGFLLMLLPVALVVGIVTAVVVSYSNTPNFNSPYQDNPRTSPSTSCDRTRPTTTRRRRSKGSRGNSCFCLDSENQEKKVVLNCSHEFHYNCIKRWCDENNCCPLCRERINVQI